MKRDDELKSVALRAVRKRDKSATATGAIQVDASIAGQEREVFCTVYAGRWDYLVALTPEGKVISVVRK